MAHILMLTPQLPYPPHQGTSLRNLHMLKALSKEHEVTLLSFAEPDRPQEIWELAPFARVLPPVLVPSRTKGDRLGQLLSTTQPDVALRLRSEAYAAALCAALDEFRFDAVQIEGIEMAHVMDPLRRGAPNLRLVLDCHNAETELQRRALRADLETPARWPAALYSSLQVGRLARYERRALAAADAAIAVSETDKAHLNQLAPGRPITVIPNTIDVEQYARHAAEPAHHFDLVFTGKMDYRPNVDGVLWFADAVWPRVLSQRPGATWAIVGQRPHPRLEALRAVRGITLTGHVPQVQPYLVGAAVYIVPLRIGSGTRLKIIEAMASGKPVVSTTIGAEGFAAEHGRNIVLADEPRAWADAILTLLKEPRRRAAIGAAAREFAAQYDWRRIVPLVSALYAE